MGILDVAEIVYFPTKAISDSHHFSLTAGHKLLQIESKSQKILMNCHSAYHGVFQVKNNTINFNTFDGLTISFLKSVHNGFPFAVKHAVTEATISFCKASNC